MRAWLSRWRAEVLLFVLVLAATAPTVQVLMAHQASRLALTAAIWDDATVQIDEYGPGLLEGLGPRESDGIISVDHAIREGHLYSDKAPGQPFLAAPFYGLARMVGAEPGVEERFFDNLTLWWTSLWSAAIPAALLAVMMRRAALRVTGDPQGATVAAIGLALSTMLLPFGTVLFGHVLSAALGFAAYLAARDPAAPLPRLAAAGLLGGLAVVTEYTTGIVVIVVGVLVLVRHGAGALAYIGGGLPAVAVLAVYNTVAWGSPTTFSYDFSGTFGTFHDQGLFGISLPDPALTLQVLAGERGLFTLTPVVLVGVIGLCLLLRDRRTRGAGLVGLVVFGLFVSVQGGWFSVTAGASPGPRYVVPALPFLAAGVARAWRWSRHAVVLAIVVGAVAMFAAILTNPLAQPTETFTFGHWVDRMVDGSWGQNLLTPWLGAPWGQVIQLAVVAVLVEAAWSAGRRDAADQPRPATLTVPAGPAPAEDPTD